MNDQLFGSAEPSGLEPELVTMVAVAVYDRGPSVDCAERYEAQLAGYSVVQARAASSWQAVRRLVSQHRPPARAALVGRRRPVTWGGRREKLWREGQRVSAKEPPVRGSGIGTAGGLVKRLGRALLWLLVVVLLLRGLAGVLAPREPAAVVPRAAGGAGVAG